MATYTVQISVPTPLSSYVLSRGKSNSSWAYRASNPIGIHAATGCLFNSSQFDVIPSDATITGVKLQLDYKIYHESADLYLRVYTNMKPSNSYTGADLIGHYGTTTYSALFLATGGSATSNTVYANLNTSESSTLINTIKDGDMYIYIFGGEDNTSTSDYYHYFSNLTLHITYTIPDPVSLNYYYNGTINNKTTTINYYYNGTWNNTINVADIKVFNGSTWVSPTS